MKKILLSVLLVLFYVSAAEATSYRKHRVNIKPLSRTSFELTDVNFENPHIVNLKGKDFFVVSVREPGSDGRVYAVDRDGTIWWMGRISSGAGGGELVTKGNKLVPRGGHETNNNIFHILAKRRFHMSSTHPNPSGKNNMDFEVQFTHDGQALHLGNTAAMSHGCIHVGRQDIGTLFTWAKIGMPVVVMRGSYYPFVQEEINTFKQDLKAFDSKTGSIDEHIK